MYIHICIYIYIYVYIYIYIYMYTNMYEPYVRSIPVKRERRILARPGTPECSTQKLVLYYSYEAFARLAETRLAQNSLNYVKLA